MTEAIVKLLLDSGLAGLMLVYFGRKIDELTREVKSLHVAIAELLGDRRHPVKS